MSSRNGSLALQEVYAWLLRIGLYLDYCVSLHPPEDVEMMDILQIMMELTPNAGWCDVINTCI